MASKTNVIPLILAGGSGTRLWPKSVPAVPKQYQAFFNPHTLFQQTAQRTNGGVHAMYLDPIVSCSAAHADVVRQQLKSIDAVPQALILEPVGRNSAPAMAIAALHAHSIAPGALLLALPADHAIPDATAFAQAVETGAPFAAAGDIVTLGIQPRGPETGYGYIQAGEHRGPGGRRVVRFVEKPNRETAETYLAEGSYVWNAGIFLFSPDAMIEEFRAHAPALLDQARRAYEASSPTRHLVSLAEGPFAACEPISVDYAIMEKSARVSVVPVSFDWNDLGSWASIWEVAAKDAHGNVIDGPVKAVDCRDCLIFSDGEPVSVMGLTDMIVVAANGRTMMAPRHLSERVGELARADKR